MLKPDITPGFRELSPAKREGFRRTIYQHYRAHGRRFPWRETYDPYAILVSEVMLQQTQVERVSLKYEPFLERFGDVASLAAAPLAEVLAAWQGLGYNRRALNLWRLARLILAEHQGRLPASLDRLLALPGLGPASAGAVAAFAFGQPVAFIETNIRRVFLHFFWTEASGVRDRDILPLVAQTLDRDRVRDWYYALMDYGAHLKKLVPNPNRRSAHYARQPPFAGSDRELRGRILRALLAEAARSPAELARALGEDPDRIGAMVNQLIREGFLEQAGSRICLASG